MTCERASALQHLYIDSRLDFHRVAALEAHLSRCSRCRHDLDVLGTVRAAVATPESIPMPADLTMRIMSRIAQSEERRAAKALARYRLSWADAKLAAFFATATTLLFVIISPVLRLAVGGALRGAFPSLIAALLAPGPGSIAWLAWFVWIVVGVGLTFWLAGSEVREMWRRSLSQRLAQIPQLPQFR